ncbi:hypothetical protein [Psychroserpens sp. S379A]|uniref:hypothetical protein n=1 Tax=Psychroserpens sp. S379A TaxID=3415137 RepID=UPI003C79E38B
MKKNILLIVAALFLFLGNQSINAQAKMEKEVKTYDLSYIKANAKKKTKSLISYLDLNNKQQEQVYNLFIEVGQKIGKLQAKEDTKQKAAFTARMERYVSDSMKDILNQDQLKKYLAKAKDL